MAAEVARPSFGQRLAAVPQAYREIVAEMKKVTWPDRVQTLDATWRIIVFVLLLGLVIFVMDWLLQGLLVRLIPSLFGAR